MLHLALQSGPQFAPLAVILGTILIPSTALVLALFLTMHMVGLFNTPWAIILPGFSQSIWSLSDENCLGPGV
jgi:ABC-type glycerol-3-phosphate transport system permease component